MVNPVPDHQGNDVEASEDWRNTRWLVYTGRIPIGYARIGRVHVLTNGANSTLDMLDILLHERAVGAAYLMSRDISPLTTPKFMSILC
jgi:hypothetical protein